MAVGYGMKSHVMWNFQDSYGTSQVTSLQAIPVTEESLNLEIEVFAEENFYARFGESPYHEGQHSISGDISMQAHPIAMGWLLKSTLGLTSTTSDTNDQTHVFKPRTTDFDGYAAGDPATVEVYYDTGSAAVYYDLVGNNLSLSVTNGELLSVTAGFVGAGFSRKAAGSPTYTEAKPFIWNQFSGSYDGNDICELKDLTVDYNNNVEADWTLCASKAPQRIKRTSQQTVELSGTMLFEAHSYMQEFEAQTEKRFLANFAGQEAPNSLLIDIPKMRFETFEVSIADAGMIEASFTARGIFDTTSNYALEITLVNTQEYY